VAIVAGEAEVGDDARASDGPGRAVIFRLRFLILISSVRAFAVLGATPLIRGVEIEVDAAERTGPSLWSG